MKTFLRTLAIVLAFTISSATTSEAAAFTKSKGKYRSVIRKAKYKRSSKRFKKVDVSKCPGVCVSRNAF